MYIIKSEEQHRNYFLVAFLVDMRFIKSILCQPYVSDRLKFLDLFVNESCLHHRL